MAATPRLRAATSGCHPAGLAASTCRPHPSTIRSGQMVHVPCRRALARLTVAVLLGLPAAGCLDTLAAGGPSGAAPAVDRGAVLLVATTRRAADDPDRSPWFGGQRGKGLTFAEARLTRPDRSLVVRMASVVERRREVASVRRVAQGGAAAPAFAAAATRARRAAVRARLPRDLRLVGDQRRPALGRHPVFRGDRAVHLAVGRLRPSTTATTARARCGRATRSRTCCRPWPRARAVGGSTSWLTRWARS